MWTPIRLLVEEQSDLSPHCLSVCRNAFDVSIYMQQTTSSEDIFKCIFFAAGEVLIVMCQTHLQQTTILRHISSFSEKLWSNILCETSADRLFTKKIKALFGFLEKKAVCCKRCSLTLCMLGNFSPICCRLLAFFKSSYFKKFFQEHYQGVKQFGSRSGLTCCQP